MTKALFEVVKVTGVLFWLVWLALLFLNLRRQLIAERRWGFDPEATEEPKFRVIYPGKVVLLRRGAPGCFVLGLKQPEGRNFAIAEFPARSWTAAFDEAQRLVPGLVIEMDFERPPMRAASAVC